MPHLVHGSNCMAIQYHHPPEYVQHHSKIETVFFSLVSLVCCSIVCHMFYLCITSSIQCSKVLRLLFASSWAYRVHCVCVSSLSFYGIYLLINARMLSALRHTIPPPPPLPPPNTIIIHFHRVLRYDIITGAHTSLVQDIKHISSRNS